MAQVVVAVGSNIEREKNITAALNQLAETFGGLDISPVYESTDDVKSDKNEKVFLYYNLVVAFNSKLDIAKVKENLLLIEKNQQRERKSSVVTLDLDLLLYDDVIQNKQGYVLPHKDILECDYVLRPLSDLFSEKEHPVNEKSYHQLWFEKKLKKELVPVDFIWNGDLISQAVKLAIL